MNIQFFKKSLTLVFMIGLPGFIHAQKSQESTPYLDWAFENIILLLASFVIVGVCFTLWNLITSMVKFQQSELRKSQGLPPEVISYERGESIFKKLYDNAWSLVPIDKEGDIELDHDYDGIKELDNRLPPWWVWTFYLSIAFGVGYLYVYHFSDVGLNQSEEYASEMKIAEDQKFAYLAKQANAIDESNVIAITNVEELERGKGVFISNCAACHGVEGQGGVGPNLTDQYWVNGGSIQDIFKTIKYGVPEKGMIAWKAQLQPASIQKVASYILTLVGTNPPNPKAAEGELYTPPVEITETE